jgi:hypothetical protein
MKEVATKKAISASIKLFTFEEKKNLWKKLVYNSS